MARRGFMLGRAQSRDQFIRQSFIVIANHHARHIYLPSFPELWVEKHFDQAKNKTRFVPDNEKYS
jgi:hypothetical protein